MKIIYKYIIIAVLMCIPYLLVLADLRFLDNGVNKFSLTGVSHSVFLLINLYLIFRLGKSKPELRNGIYLIFGLFLCMLIRENREIIRTITDQSIHWSWLAWPAAIIFCVAGFRKPAKALRDLKELTNIPDYNFFIAGVLVILVWSRLIGNRFLWMFAAGDNYMGVLKNTAEEPTQSAGYLLCISGLIFMTYRYFQPDKKSE